MTTASHGAAEDVRLPENAFRPLAEGERYQPVVPPAGLVPEVTVRSIVQGALWAIVQRQAAILTFNDVFRFMGILILIVVPLSFLMRRPRSKRGAPVSE